MVVGILTGAGLLAGGWLFGKAGGGGVDVTTELFTKKEYKSTQITEAYTYAPTISRTTDISYTYITESPYAQVVSKKEQAISQVPTVSPVIIPTTAQASPIGAGAGAGAGFDIWSAVIIAGIIGAGYYVLKKKK